MNPWRRGSLLVNPYYRNAFRVARVPREAVRHLTMVQLISQTKQLIAADPGAHSIAGKPVTESDVNEASQILLDAPQRIVEELLVHSSETAPLEGLRARLREVAAVMTGEASTPLVPDWHTLLLPIAADVVEKFLRAEPCPDPCFGALELKLIPPFGEPEE